MARHPSQFNPSLRMPLIDILVAIILIVVTRHVWLQTKGEERLNEVQTEVLQARRDNDSSLAATRATLAAAEQEEQDMIHLHDAKEQFLAFLIEQTAAEQAGISAGEQLGDQHDDQLRELSTAIQRARSQRFEYYLEIQTAERSIGAEREDVAALEEQVAERNAHLERLDGWIRTAEQRLQEDPPTLFPKKTALSSLVEISDLEESLVFNLTHDLHPLGGFDVGLLGSLGVATDGNASLKEGGLYANLPIKPRRASIDFEAGVSHLESRTAGESDTSPFAGASLRLAPLSRERFFLVVGTRYGHDDLALRLGLAFGRR